MNKYRIIFTNTEKSYIEVEAENEREANEKAIAEWNAGNSGEPMEHGTNVETETQDIAARLEYLRGEIEAERISYGEIAELQSLAEYIEPGDVQLLEWAGVPENGQHGDTCTKYNEPALPDEDGNCSLCGAKLEEGK